MLKQWNKQNCIEHLQKCCVFSTELLKVTEFLPIRIRELSELELAGGGLT